MITAGMTAFYVFRAIFLAFFGEYRGHHHPHESPLVMTVPLMVLAVLSLVGGFHSDSAFPRADVLPQVHEAARCMARGYVATAAGLLGIAAGVSVLRREARAGRFDGRQHSAACTAGSTTSTSSMKSTTRWWSSRWSQGSRAVLWRGIDVGLIDGIVNGVGTALAKIGGASAAAAIGQHTQLRGMGGARVGRRDCRAWDSREASDEPPTTSCSRCPLIAFLIVLLLARRQRRREPEAGARPLVARVLRCRLAAVAPVLVAAGEQMSFVTDVQWITYPNIRYHVGVDGVSLWLVLLSTLPDADRGADLLEVHSRSGRRSSTRSCCCSSSG